MTLEWATTSSYNGIFCSKKKREIWETATFYCLIYKTDLILLGQTVMPRSYFSHVDKDHEAKTVHEKGGHNLTSATELGGYCCKLCCATSLLFCVICCFPVFYDTPQYKICRSCSQICATRISAIMCVAAHSSNILFVTIFTTTMPPFRPSNSNIYKGIRRRKSREKKEGKRWKSWSRSLVASRLQKIPRFAMTSKHAIFFACTRYYP